MGSASHRNQHRALPGKQPSLWPAEVEELPEAAVPAAHLTPAGKVVASTDIQTPSPLLLHRRRTPSFVCEVPLRAGPAEERALQARLEAARALYNACLGEARRRWSLLRQSRAYQQARKLQCHTPERTEAFKAAKVAHGFTSAALQVYAKECRHQSHWIEAAFGLGGKSESGDSRLPCGGASRHRESQARAVQGEWAAGHRGR